MKRKNVLLSLGFVLLLSLEAWAQNRTVSGRILDPTGQPAIGATVSVKGNTQIATITDIEGRYTLSVPEGAILVINYTGSKKIEVPATRDQIDVTLEEGGQLETIYVNALGFKEDRDTKGVSSSNINAGSVVQSGETGLINGMAGKASGVFIQRTSGDPGAGSYIQIRGQNTLNGASQPLIVVDGIPIYNSNFGSATDGVAQQSRLNDINPDDIESIEVLKGAAAGALWGTRAANGVIVITTKRGKQNGKVNISYRSTYSIDEVNVKYPLQSRFGQGTAGRYSPTNSLSWGDEIALRSGGADVVDLTGAYFVAESGRSYYRILQKNDRSTFVDNNFDQVFRKGWSWENSVSISGGDTKNSFLFSLADLNAKGVIKNNSDYRRTSLRFNADKIFNQYLTFKTSSTYVRTSSNRIQQGSNLSGLMLGLLRTPPDFDNSDYKGTVYTPGALPQFDLHRSYRRYLGSTNPVYNNPSYTINEQENSNTVNRIISSAEFTLSPVNFFDLTTRAGIDYYSDNRKTRFPIYSANFQNGRYIDETISETQFNLDVIGRFRHNFNENISGNLLIGFNFNNRRLLNIGGQITDFIIDNAPDNLSNSTSENSVTFNTEQVIRTNAGYITLGFSIFDQLYINLTGRREAASTFGPLSDGAFGYPSADIAWQFTQLSALKDNPIISFGKLRAAYGTVGIQPIPYITSTDFVSAAFTESWGPTLNASAYGGSFVRSLTKGNPNLKPERVTELEVGTDLRFIKDRLRFSFTHFWRESQDVILPVDIAPSTGFVQEQSNAATLENKGVEIDLGFEIIPQKENRTGFGWDISGNWTRIRNKVTDLSGTTSLFLAGFTGTSSRAVVGQPIGVLWGNPYSRNDAGQLVLDANGFPTQALSEGVIGDPNQDWRGAVGNTFSYNKFSLYVLFEHWQGGDVWAGTESVLKHFGTWEGTANTVQSDQPLRTYNGQTIPANTPFRGAIRDFGAGPVALTEAWYTSLGGGFGPVSEDFIYDATNTRLREITLSYTLNTEGFKKATRLGSADFSITGRNLLLWTPNFEGFDPDTNLTGPSAGRGLNYFQNPNTRSYVFTVRLNF